jgi:hypothetical protein
MKKRLWSIALLLLLVATAFVPTALADDDDDDDGGGTPQTVVMVSGNGSPPGRDPLTRFSTDGGLTWQQAFIVQKHPAYANPIPGSEWISVDANLGAPIPPLETRYQRFFDLPEDCEATTLSVILHVDNDATLLLNGVPFGATPQGPIPTNFMDPPEGPFVAVGPFQESGNVLEFEVSDQGVVTGLDFEATLSLVCDGDDDDGDDDDGGDDDDDGDDDD